jgi:hypothetical protein
MEHELDNPTETDNGSWTAPRLVPLSSLGESAGGPITSAAETGYNFCTYAPS